MRKTLITTILFTFTACLVLLSSCASESDAVQGPAKDTSTQDQATTSASNAPDPTESSTEVPSEADSLQENLAQAKSLIEKALKAGDTNNVTINAESFVETTNADGMAELLATTTIQGKINRRATPPTAYVHTHIETSDGVQEFETYLTDDEATLIQNDGTVTTLNTEESGMGGYLSGQALHDAEKLNPFIKNATKCRIETTPESYIAIVLNFDSKATKKAITLDASNFLTRYEPDSAQVTYIIHSDGTLYGFLMVYSAVDEGLTYTSSTNAYYSDYGSTEVPSKPE